MWATGSRHAAITTHWALPQSSPENPLEHTQKAREVDLQAFDLKLGDAHETSYQALGIGTSVFVMRHRDVRFRASDVLQRQTILKVCELQRIYGSVFCVDNGALSRISRTTRL